MVDQLQKAVLTPCNVFTVRLCIELIGQLCEHMNVIYSSQGLLGQHTHFSLELRHTEI